MFLHCVALNAAEVQVPWAKFAREANSLFLFRLVISLLSLVVTLPLAGGFLLVVLRMALREGCQPCGSAVGRSVGARHDRHRDRVLGYRPADEGLRGAASVFAPAAAASTRGASWAT